MCFKTDFVFVWTTISDNVNVGSTHTKLLERLFTKKNKIIKKKFCVSLYF